MWYAGVKGKESKEVGEFDSTGGRIFEKRNCIDLQNLSRE